MSLPTFWFCLIAVLWAGYFVLEGFDFGVGMLLPVIGRSDDDKDAMLDTIGPVWDGNEVWLVTAGGATFAAFPTWYAIDVFGVLRRAAAGAGAADGAGGVVRVARRKAGARAGGVPGCGRTWWGAWARR